MTHFWTRASVMVLATAALGACTTPQYPTEAGQPAGQPLTMPTPNFPIVESTPMATSDDAPAATAPTATAPVESTALPPPSAATAPTPTPVASSTLAPLTTTTTATPAPTVAAPALVQMVPTQVTETKTVPIADGKVISVQGKPATYVVRKGDHIDSIARKLGTTRTQLVKDNDLRKPYRIHPGDTLSGPSRKSKAYVVESGDTLYAVARRFSVKAARLADENDVSVNAGLRPGQKLVLPSGYHDTGAGKRTVTTTRTVMRPAPAPAPSAVQTVVQSQTTPTTTLTAPARPVAATTVSPAPLGTAPAVTTTTTVTPAPKPYTPPVTQVQPAPRVTPPVTTAPPVSKPYTPAPSPYMPPRTTAPAVTAPVPTAPVSKPYTPSPSPYVPPTTTMRPVTPGVSPMVQSSAPPTDNEIAAAGAGRFIQPVTGDIISGYGPKIGGQRNDGVNFAAPAGTPVRAAAAGEVVYAGDQVPGFGNLVLVKHDGGWVTAYAHMGRVDVKMRDMVGQGQQIGQVGSTGGVVQPQLHFEVRYAPTPQDKARPVDPTLVLPH